MKKEKIEVKTYRYHDIYEKFSNLVVPHYQRAYTWSTEKIEDLIDDWKEFVDGDNSEKTTYYMGTLLFYCNDNGNYEIIDGQQRLTTLALINHCLYHKLLGGQNMSFNQYASAHNIVKNSKYLQNRKAQLEELEKAAVLSKLQFTIIVTHNEDNAFTFFDSQNNRGVNLDVDDYLKAYHLRAIPEVNQESMAKQWEAISYFARKSESYELNLEYLFNDILFKSRQWKGQRYFPFSAKENVLNEFQKQTHKAKNGDSQYRLFANNNNMRFHAVEYQKDNSLMMLSKEKMVVVNSLPFSIRQPLFEGHNFFLFTQKYHSVFKLLFYEEHKKYSELHNAAIFYKSIYNKNMSSYLRRYMQLCMVMYYDNFGVESICEAVQHFDYLIGSIRVDKYYVRYEAVKNSLSNLQYNILDVIQGAFLPDEVFEFIKSQDGITRIYKDENRYRPKDKDYRNNVIKRYIERVCDYYDKDIKEFKNRNLWLT